MNERKTKQMRTTSSKRRTSPERESTRKVNAVHEQLRYWKEQNKVLAVEIGAGVVRQVGFGIVREFARGNFAVEFLLPPTVSLDDEWKRYAKLGRERG